MARTIDQIYSTMTTKYVQLRAGYSLPFDDPALWSIANLKRLVFNVIAYCHWLLETLFDTAQADNLAALALKKPHTERWYSDQAKLFQFGFPLLGETDGFDNTGYSSQQIADSFVVNYAAVTEQENIFGRIYLRMKLATVSGSDLAALDGAKLDAFTTWFKTKKRDAGVKLQIDSLPPDNLQQRWRIYYDPLILSATGYRLDGQANSPVQDAIAEYLKNLPFNGVYVPQYHIDAVQLVQGVVIAELLICNVRYGSLPYTAVNDIYTPDAGYLRLYNPTTDLVIEWVAQPAIK